MPFPVAILTKGPVELPAAYTALGAAVSRHGTPDEFLSCLQRAKSFLWLVDAALAGDHLPHLLERALEQDPRPFVAVFGAAPAVDEQLPFRAFTEAMGEVSLAEALKAAWPHVSLAARVAALEERSGKVARLEKRVFDFFTLSQVGKALASIQGLSELSRVFLSMVREVYDSENCALLLHDDANTMFRVQDALGLDADAVRELAFPLREGLFWQLLNAGEPFPIVDSQGNYRFEQQIRRFGLDALHSTLWVPLKLKNALIGILTVGRKTSGDPYHGEERNYIAQLANQAVVAFEFARLTLQKEETTKALAKKMENLSILYSVSKAMNFMNDLKRVLLLILEKAVDAVGAQKASLMLIEDETGELVVKVVKGVPPDVEQRINSGEQQCARIRVGEGIAGRVAATRRPILVDDVRNSEFAEPGKSYADNILCVPLVAGDECIGVINITNKKSNQKFVQDDVDIMLTLAGQAAVTIHNARLYYLAITDGLTQLHIHRYFQQRLKEEMARAKRFEHPLSLIMIDIDHFKRFNDTYGHQHGDLVLIHVARTLRTTIREVDIAARYGGEEFVVICPETGADEAAILADRLRRRVEELIVSGPPGGMSVTISLGIAECPAHAATPELLIQAADQALYSAKEAGRNRIARATTPAPRVVAGG